MTHVRASLVVCVTDVAVNCVITVVRVQIDTGRRRSEGCTSTFAHSKDGDKPGFPS